MLQTNTPPQKVLAGSFGVLWKLLGLSVQCVVLGTFVSVVLGLLPGCTLPFLLLRRPFFVCTWST